MADENLFTLSKKEELIVAVQQNPCLYDKKHVDYKDKFVRENTWKKITRILKFDDKRK